MELRDNQKNKKTFIEINEKDKTYNYYTMKKYHNRWELSIYQRFQKRGRMLLNVMLQGKNKQRTEIKCIENDGNKNIIRTMILNEHGIIKDNISVAEIYSDTECSEIIFYDRVNEEFKKRKEPHEVYTGKIPNTELFQNFIDKEKQLIAEIQQLEKNKTK